MKRVVTTQNAINMRSEIVKNCTHQMLMNRPVKICNIIIEFIKENQNHNSV